MRLVLTSWRMQLCETAEEKIIASIIAVQIFLRGHVQGFPRTRLLLFGLFSTSKSSQVFLNIHSQTDNTVISFIAVMYALANHADRWFVSELGMGN